MVLIITQETFDASVKENIDDLGMQPEEALQETIIQFEKQGVDLSNIVKKLTISDDQMEVIKEALGKLKHISKSKDSKEIITQLEVVKNECEKGIEVRVAAGKAGAYNVLLSTLTYNKDDFNIEKACFKALIALMTKQPDLLENNGTEIIIKYLEQSTESELKRLVLKWTKECCVMHEMNRQCIFNANIVDKLKELLNDRHGDVLRDVLSVCRALVLDDDVRVEFGKAHEHARIIASETLCTLIGILTRFRTEELLVTDIILTVSTLLVRTEFCKKVEDAGGLELIKETMQTFLSHEKIIRQCFKLLKALAGNDDCKAHILQKNLAPVITEALNKNTKSTATSVAGLACVAALNLRSPENSKAFYDAGICPVIIEIMKLHQDDKQIQKTASWAIRNMVSRSRYQNELFLELGIEDILQKNLKKFKEIEYDTKAALRDLGCKVNFKEEWTGKGGALTSGLTNIED